MTSKNWPSWVAVRFYLCDTWWSVLPTLLQGNSFPLGCVWLQDLSQNMRIYLLPMERKLSFPLLLSKPNKSIESLTADKPVLGATLRDINAGHCADSWVCSEAPGEFLAIWISTEVLSQVPGKHKRKSCCNLLKCKCKGEWVDGWIM